MRILTQRIALADLPEFPVLSGQDAARLDLLGDPRLQGFSAENAIFFDVEATGLARGCGTFAFLIGLAWFEEDHLVIEQLFAEDPSREPALLHHFLERLTTRSHLVSYNGKSYDVSVLQARLVINRFMDHREAELRLRPHLDLLHSGRRLWRGLLPNHRLSSLEKDLLGLERIDDVPGALVPSLYFGFVNTGNEHLIRGVIEHNRQDVLSLVRLTHHLALDLDPKSSPDPIRAVNLAAMFRGRDQAVQVLDLLPPETLAALDDRALLEKAGDLRDWALRRTGLGRDRPALWKLLADLDPSPPILEKLSLVLEKEARDPVAALEAASRAGMLGISPSLEKRIIRLKDRVSRLHKSD